MSNKSIQTEDETLELISKNDLTTLSLKNYIYMIIDILKYNNSLYMTFVVCNYFIVYHKIWSVCLEKCFRIVSRELLYDIEI
jgi:hypothetical protein